MRELSVYLEIKGAQKFIGTLRGSGPEDTVFTYDESYMSSPIAKPVSISLPLQAAPFSPTETGNFFDGLLPEGFTRRTVSQWVRADEGDYPAILAHLGNECLGAIRIVEDGSPEPSPSYEPLGLDRIRALAQEGATQSAQLVAEAHLSLTGASGKVGLYHDGSSGHWYLPLGSAPSNCIVKQSHVRYDAIVTNEKLCLLTASKLGIAVPHSFIIDTGDSGEGDVLFATERYDRKEYSDDTISGLKRPLRLHQEDFCQALGVPPVSKYERSGDSYLPMMTDLLRHHSTDPIDDIIGFWDMVVFNWLIGNTDAHPKNYSLLYSDDLSSVRLAPAYDMVSTVIYEGTSRNMSFNIGGEYAVEKVSRDNWLQAASQAGIGRGLAIDRLDRLAETLRPALLEASEELCSLGFSKAKNIAENILLKGGISKTF